MLFAHHVFRIEAADEDEARNVTTALGYYEALRTHSLAFANA